MATTVRVATFNLENFDDPGPNGQPTLVQRISLMRPQLERLRADVLCLQEVHSQQVNGVRTFAALDQLGKALPTLASAGQLRPLQRARCRWTCGIW